MKKLLMLSAATVVLSASAAFAADEPKADVPPNAPKQAEMPKAPEAIGGDMLQKIDTDGDGAISEKEFMAFHEARFKEMDNNSDGKITKEEGEAARNEWREKMKKIRDQRMKENPPPKRDAKDAKKAPVKGDRPQPKKPVKPEAKETAPVEKPADAPAVEPSVTSPAPAETPAVETPAVETPAEKPAE